jgi:hypothetical protein
MLSMMPMTLANQVGPARCPDQARRNLSASIDVTVCQALFKIGVIGERRLFGQIERAAQLFEIGPACVAPVVVKDGEGKVVDVGRNANAEHNRQECRPEHGKNQAGSGRAPVLAFHGPCRQRGAADGTTIGRRLVALLHRPGVVARLLDTSKGRLSFGANRLIPGWRCGGSGMAGQAGFFDVEERLKELSAKGDVLERLSAVLDFETVSC